MVTAVHSDYYWFGSYYGYKFAFPFRDSKGQTSFYVTQHRCSNDYLTPEVGIFDDAIVIDGQKSVDHLETNGFIYDALVKENLSPIGFSYSGVIDGTHQRFTYYDGISCFIRGEIWKHADGKFIANADGIWYTSSTYKGWGDYNHNVQTRVAQEYVSSSTAIPVSGFNDTSWYDKFILYPSSSSYLAGERINGGAPLSDNFVTQIRIPITDYSVVNWGQLAMQAVENVGFQSNGIAYIKDLAELGTFVSNSARDLRKIGGINAKVLKEVKESSYSITNAQQLKLLRGNAKYLAGLYLSIHYGYKLFVQDTEELLQYFSTDHGDRRQSTATESFKHGNGMQSNFITICYDANRQLSSTLDRVTRELDLDLSLEKLWDLTPWSFVIDWGLDLSTTFSQMDSFYSLTNVHDVRYVLQTRKWISDLVTQYAGYACSLYVERYTRVPTNELLFSGINLPKPGNPSNHWFEAGALFVANT